MSSTYATEPPPTATVLLHTTAGPLTISLFAQQTPITSRNFLQHVLDGYYENCIFHRVSPGFVIQTGDPTGTGEGGENIYADGDKSNERYDDKWAKMLKFPEERYNERIVLKDEIHSRLKFNRRGLIGMAKMSDEVGPNQYGSQFFITLADCRSELDGKCTMFGRIEGEGIYNVMKIADAEMIEGTERPMYPEKIIKAEVIEMPSGDAWASIQKREIVARRTIKTPTVPVKKKPRKKAKNLLTFGGDEEEDGLPVAFKSKAKVNTSLFADAEEKPATESFKSNKPIETKVSNAKALPNKRKSPEPSKRVQESSEPEPKRRKPSFHDSTTQFPIRDPESPSNSTPGSTPRPLPSRYQPVEPKSASSLEAEIAALKASMRRDAGPVEDKKKNVSALEALIPATSTRGRRRPRPGESTKDSDQSLRLLDAFKAQLESSNKDKLAKSGISSGSHATEDDKNAKTTKDTTEDDEEAALCDLHFIANCQSCSNWAGDDKEKAATAAEDEDPMSIFNHSLTFEKDRLGKDLEWKRKNEEELVVIDPRERERELGIKGKKVHRHEKGRR